VRRIAYALQHSAERILNHVIIMSRISQTSATRSRTVSPRPAPTALKSPVRFHRQDTSCEAQPRSGPCPESATADGPEDRAFISRPAGPRPPGRGLRARRVKRVPVGWRALLSRPALPPPAAAAGRGSEVFEPGRGPARTSTAATARRRRLACHPRPVRLEDRCPAAFDPPASRRESRRRRNGWFTSRGTSLLISDSAEDGRRRPAAAVSGARS
jgi:hypothetical protein